MPFTELEGHPDASVVLLHAHPDDETLATGGLMARLVADGCRVTLVTGTRGERGEVVAGPLKHLEGTPALAATRVAELSAAMRALGVSDHRFLGAIGNGEVRGIGLSDQVGLGDSESGSNSDSGEGRLDRRPGDDAASRVVTSGFPAHSARAAGLPARTYSDSGMQWSPDGNAIAADDAPAEALSLAPLDEVVADILFVLTDTLPRLIISYDERGGYGHPDHVRMYEAGVEAARRSGVPLYEIVPDWNGDTPTIEGDIVVPLGEHRSAKFAALAAHATQLTVVGGDIVLSGGQRHTVASTEVFRRHGHVIDDTPNPITAP